MDTSFGGLAAFSGAQFRRKANFLRATIGGQASFRPDQSGLRTAFFGQCVFEAARFQGSADFAAVVVGEDALFPAATFEADAWFDGATFLGESDFRSVETKREMFFSDSSFKGLADFRDARFRVVYFRSEMVSPSGWVEDVIRGIARAISLMFLIEPYPTGFTRQNPDDQFLNKVDLRGMTYDRMYGAWGTMLGKNSVYDSQPYTQLEQALRRSGDDAIADNVFYAQRVREFGNRFHWPAWLNVPGILWDLFLRLSAGYGVRPFRLVLLTLAVLAWGAELYSRPGAVADSDVSGSSTVRHLDHLEAFRVSLDQLLPVELPQSDQLEPTAQVAFQFGSPAVTYEGFAAIQSLIGWVILPVALAILASCLWRERPTRPLQ